MDQGTWGRERSSQPAKLRNWRCNRDSGECTEDNRLTSYFIIYSNCSCFQQKFHFKKKRKSSSYEKQKAGHCYELKRKSHLSLSTIHTQDQRSRAQTQAAAGLTYYFSKFASQRTREASDLIIQKWALHLIQSIELQHRKGLHYFIDYAVCHAVL